LDGLWWLIILLGPLYILQRRLHFEAQAVFLLLTRSKEITIALFSLLFFPGVLLHESSHYVMARLLGVRTGRFSLIPRPTAAGRVQLGFVETAATDVFRDALIGVAPLVLGGVFVAYTGIVQLGLPAVWESFMSGEVSMVLSTLRSLPAHPDFWLWFYLVFAVSSTMLPSASDRRAWPALGLFIGLILVVGFLVGAGPWMLANAGPYLNRAFRALAVVMGITVAVHLVLLPPAWSLRMALSRWTGMRVR
jgi:hypothetical protein